MESVTSAMSASLPADALASQAASSPRITIAKSSAIPLPAAARSLSFTGLQHERVASPVVSQADSLLAQQCEHKSIEDLCFEAASLGITESNSKVSVAETECESNSSNSENSSIQALEVSLGQTVLLLASQNGIWGQAPLYMASLVQSIGIIGHASPYCRCRHAEAVLQHS